MGSIVGLEVGVAVDNVVGMSDGGLVLNVGSIVGSVVGSSVGSNVGDLSID